jgi:hypothetical protein
MEQMFWVAACSIRGEEDASKLKDYLLPLLFMKRLSDVFDDEIQRLTDDFGDRGAEAHEWPSEGDPPRSTAPADVGQHLTKASRAIVKHNPALSGVIDTVDFAAERSGERDINPAKLRAVVKTFSDPRYRLGLSDVQPDFLGRAYEYLLRKFAEGSGQSAGEFFTPTEVGFLLAYLMKPRPGERVATTSPAARPGSSSTSWAYSASSRRLSASTRRTWAGPSRTSACSRPTSSNACATRGARGSWLDALAASGEGPDEALERIIYGSLIDEAARKSFYVDFKDIENLWEILSPDAALRDYVDDYKALAALYAATRNAYAECIGFIADLAHKTRRLIEANAEQMGLDRLSRPVTFDAKTTRRWRASSFRSRNEPSGS